MSESETKGEALSRYLAYFGPICNHHRDDCPDDCEGQLAWQASAELVALTAAAASARALAIDDAAKVCDLWFLGTAVKAGQRDLLARIASKIRALSPQRAAGSEA